MAVLLLLVVFLQKVVILQMLTGMEIYLTALLQKLVLLVNYCGLKLMVAIAMIIVIVS